MSAWQYALTGILRRFMLALLLGGVGVLQAASGPWSEDGPVKARLISPAQDVLASGRLAIGMQIVLKDGWKTYWRTPGAAGAPPKLHIQHPALGQPEWLWPAPERHEQFGQQLYGYTGTVVIPVRYVVDTDKLTGSPLPLQATASVFVCSDVCIPVKLALSLDVPLKKRPGESGDWKENRLYGKYLSRVPVKRVFPGQSVLYDGGALYLAFPLDVQGDSPDAFPEELAIHEWPAPHVQREGRMVRFWWQAPDLPGSLTLPETVHVTYRDSLQAIEVQVPVVRESVPPLPADATSVAGRHDQGDEARDTLNEKWLWMILIALAGGLVLNLMPCVLPVISIKLMAWSHLTGAAQKIIRQHALMTILGILSLFWLMAGALMLLRSMGVYVGWGIQFQNPYFLLFLIVLLSLFAANFMGWFEFRLPEKWQDSLSHAGGQSSGLWSSYVHGMTATLLATPCSAPFLGTAVAFALVQDIVGILIIFTALGLGLSLPYWLIVFWPGMVKRVPKAGAWTQWLKYGLSAALWGTVIWLMWVLEASISPTGFYWTLGTLVLSFVLLRINLVWRLAGVLGLWISAVVLVGIFADSRSVIAQDDHDTENQWLTFKKADWQALVEEGNIVLLDFTADWCITCQFNKKAVLETEAMHEFFRQNNVVLVQGDWTRPNPEIETMLTEYGRAGIPFNLVTGDGGRKSVVLPELLTREVVREAVLKVK